MDSGEDCMGQQYRATSTQPPLKEGHQENGNQWCHRCPHCDSMDLLEQLFLKLEYVVSEDMVNDIDDFVSGGDVVKLSVMQMKPQGRLNFILWYVSVQPNDV